MRIARLLPSSIKAQLRKVAARTFLSDRGSMRAYHGELQRGSYGSAPVRVNIRQLNNAEVKLRPATTDARTTFATFWHQFHLPPRELTMPKRPIILDLGANNGLTVAHFASLYPTAHIVGVELDKRNVSIARSNVAMWSDRCKIIHAGVWCEDGEVAYIYSEGSEDGLAISEGHLQEGHMETVRACSMATILKEMSDPDIIDYVKMDIEGAEREVLSKDASWLSRVRCIKVELHGGYMIDQCIADLSEYGITARRDVKHNLCVIGLNRNLI